MFRQVHQPFGLEDAGPDEAGLVNIRTGGVQDKYRVEQLNPFAVFGTSNHARSAAITTEQFSVG
jgi:hypothetical protein